MEGIEPPFSVLETAVLPLNDTDVTLQKQSPHQAVTRWGLKKLRLEGLLFQVVFTPPRRIAPAPFAHAIDRRFYNGGSHLNPYDGV